VEVRRPVTSSGRAERPERGSSRANRIAIAIVAAVLVLAGGLWLVSRQWLDQANGRLTAARSTASSPVATAATPAAAAASADGTTAYARQLAGLVTAVGQRNGLTLATRADLIPHAGGNAQDQTAVAAYRTSVTGAALAIGLVDQATVDAWRAAGRDGQAKALQAWTALVRGLLPNADVEIAVVGGAGPVARASLPAGARDVAVTLP
jgi:hypothetical protein